MSEIFYDEGNEGEGISELEALAITPENIVESGQAPVPTPEAAEAYARKIDSVLEAQLMGQVALSYLERSIF